MDLRQLQTDILGFVRRGYPNIDVRVEPNHYLRNLIPADYYDRHLTDSEWFELAPGERPEDLHYPDAELIDDISPDVMRALAGAKVFQALDDVLCPADPSKARQPCHGDYRHARAVLLARRFREEELFDVFHVLMARGGYCDCEILYNAVEESRLKVEYWQARAKEIEPYDPHRGSTTE